MSSASVRPPQESPQFSFAARWIRVSSSQNLRQIGFNISISPPFLKLWLWLALSTSLAGWVLSALGQLNRVGYLVFFVLAAAAFSFIARRENSHRPCARMHWRKQFRRFRQPLPAAFFILAFLVLLGGLLYAPTNYTGLVYREQRVLQWLDHGQWWWIHTPNYRMNDRACGIEWFYAPLMLFTKSDRLLVLVNFLPFLLMPGLIFSVFTRLGVGARAAWAWMWLLPCGYNFLLQGASIANDTYPTVFALAAVDFALRARRSGNISDLWWSLLAAALLTGAKASNLPLLLPWAVIIFPQLPLLLKKNLPASIGVASIAAAVSFLPTAILNVKYCGDWTGAVLESQGLAINHPLTGIWGNALLLLFNNFLPPLCPFAGWWNAHALEIFPQWLVAPMVASFEPGFHGIGELPTEDSAGLGMGLTLLLAASVLVNLFSRKKIPAQKNSRFQKLILLTPWLALLAYCAKSGMVTPQRLIAPYYPLLIAPLLIGGAHGEITRRGWWKILAAIAILTGALVLTLLPDRPLWPAKTILAKLVAQHPESAALNRALKVYTTYSLRSDPLNGVRDLLPPDVKTVGFIAGPDDMDVSLWRPFGTRRVEHFFATEPPAAIGKHVEYAVVASYNLRFANVRFDDWLAQSGAQLVGTTNATLKVGEGPQPWYLVRFPR
jgi:hypothetical protein